MISIIIPAYNIEQYIGTCIDSIIAQTYDDLEIITVDDGSSDHTGKILDSYALRHSRIKAVHKPNGGVTSARLCGVKESTGEWIGFVDGDDYIEPEMFADLLKNAEESEADISHCGYQMVFPNRIDYYYNTGKRICQSGREAVKELLGGKYEPGLCNKLFRRELFDDLLDKNRLDQSIRINEDLLMNYYLFRQAKKTVFEDVCPYHYIVHKGSAANSPLRLYKLTDPEKVRRILMQETADDKELHSICYQELIRHLIRIGSMSTRHVSEGIGKYIYSSRNSLKNELPTIRQEPLFSERLKYQAALAANTPRIYRFIHDAYGEITGAKHKYDI